MFPSSTKILIVDDMGMFRAMLKQALTELGFKNYVEFSNGEDAWKGIEAAHQAQLPFQLILADWTMPKMKGIDLLKKVRAEAWGRTLPFVMLTGEAEKEFIMEAVQNNVTGYMIKPFTVTGLKEKLAIAHKKFKESDDGIPIVA